MMRIIDRIVKYSGGFSLEIYTDKVAESGRRVIRKAYDEARARKHNQIESEHILMAITAIERPLFNQSMRRLNVEPQEVVEAIELKLSKGDYIGRGIKIGEQFNPLLSTALKQARERGDRLIEATDLFIGLFKDEQSSVVEILSQLGVDREVMRGEIDKLINEA
jgi:ATP-dependent Clp protease ATP-binding subunit ClpA